jgi:hypothetical protein
MVSQEKWRAIFDGRSLLAWNDQRRYMNLYRMWLGNGQTHGKNVLTFTAVANACPDPTRVDFEELPSTPYAGYMTARGRATDGFSVSKKG